jgi:hypothetical protein
VSWLSSWRALVYEGGRSTDGTPLPRSRTGSALPIPPTALQRARLDNLAIVPASLLPEKAEWQALANTLPVGSTLIVLPSKPSAARSALEQVSRNLSAHGSRVTTIEQDERQPRELRQEIVAQ